MPSRRFTLNKVKLELDVVLPSEASHRDPCAARLLNALRSKPGVIAAHIDDASGRPTLCIHFEPASIAPLEVEKLVSQSGAELSTRFGHLSVSVSGIRHERHARLIEGALLREPGVLHAVVGFGTRQVEVEFATQQTNRNAVLTALEKAGLGVGSAATDEHAGHDHAPGASGDHDHEHGGPFGERSELIFSLLCGALTLAGWLLTKFTGVGALVPKILFGIAYGFGGWFTVQEAVVAIRARKFEIDFLMLVAAIGAAALGELFEGALLLFLFSIGHALEGFAMSRARKAIEALTKLVPKTALRLAADDREEEVPVEKLLRGDRVRVKPNSQIPADGIVAAGNSSVNQAPITGESVPVDKRPADDLAVSLAAPEKVPAEHRVFAGTINGPSALTIVVTRVAADSTLSRVVEMVTRAESQKSPTQVMTDRFERIFVPVILAMVVLLLFAWVVRDETFATSFYRAMAVLVAASPCALAIATPSAVLSGVARAARGGVLVKGGAHLESLGTIQSIAFDKTGTLTEGKPRLTDVVPAAAATEERLLQVTLALEKQSDHPIAIAIVTGAAGRVKGEHLVATSVEAIIGFGIRATVEGETVRIGKPGLFTRDGGTLPGDVAESVRSLMANGRTVMVTQAGDAYLGVIGVMDTPRESARVVIGELKRIGIKNTIMLTGDNQSVADAVAREVGITEARGDLLPEQKVTAVAELARGEGRVAMVGDGVNDAPAMANATVGIAMGAGSSDVALETADIALMADDLSALPFAVGLSRACRAIIRQNLWASLGMVAFLIPATLFGFAGIGLAVALHEGSTLVVVANALRLLAYRDNRMAIHAATAKAAV